jgi:hypothetical protein
LCYLFFWLFSTMKTNLATYYVTFICRILKYILYIKLCSFISFLARLNWFILVAGLGSCWLLIQLPKSTPWISITYKNKLMATYWYGDDITLKLVIYLLHLLVFQNTKTNLFDYRLENWTLNRDDESSIWNLWCKPMLSGSLTLLITSRLRKLSESQNPWIFVVLKEPLVQVVEIFQSIGCFHEKNWQFTIGSLPNSLIV